MNVLEPWKEAQKISYSDRLKRFVYQQEEESLAGSLPRVLEQLPMKPTVMGIDSPHQMGDHTVYEMLTRGPFYCMTAHFTGVAPHSPVRGAHRHIVPPALFCTTGKGWEWNDGKTYNFEAYDLLLVPPYTIHQHGGDREIGCEIYVPETARVFHLLGLMRREQFKLNEKPAFPEGTEPIYDDAGKLIGYRIKKGVLGITKEIEVIFGAEPSADAAFQARCSAQPWKGEVKNSYDRYLSLYHSEIEFCRSVSHVALEREQPWEWTPHGKLKWMVHPDTETATKDLWVYFQEIPPGSRSGQHRHASEEQILVLEGRGYDVHDGERWDWQQSDLICIPAMTTHQHFNRGESRALLLSSMPSVYMHLGLGGIEQIEDAPEYAEKGG